MLHFVIGGSGSGKSEYGERLLLKTDATRKIYLATMEARDDPETRERILRHRALRAGKGFLTIEKPRALGTLLPGKRHPEDAVHTGEIQSGGIVYTGEIQSGDAVHTGEIQSEGIVISSEIRSGDALLLEDLTNLLLNEMLYEENAAEQVFQELMEINRNVSTMILIGNDIFSGVGRYDAWTEEFIRTLGQLHQRIAGEAAYVTEVIAGIPIPLKVEK